MSDDITDDGRAPAAPTASNWEIYQQLEYVNDKLDLLFSAVAELKEMLERLE